jgi:hypothetical protein
VADWQTEARNTALRVGVDPNLFVALVRQESQGNPNALSKAGAIGYTQLMPATAAGLGVDPRNPAQNLLGGAKYLKQQLDAFGGDPRKALAAYNAGPGNVQKYGGVPPFAETQAYVQAILGSLKAGAKPGHATAAPTGSSTAPAPLAQAAAAALAGFDPGEASGAGTSLIQLASAPPQAPPSGGLTPPSFAGGPVLSDAYRALSSGGPAPRRDLGQALSQILTQGGSVTGPGGAPAETASPGGAAVPLPASGGSGKVQALVPLGGSKNAGKGAFAISGPAPGRLKPGLVSFARQVAEVYGGTLTGSDGSAHSKYTVNGNVSEHYTGNATDIFQINGKPAVGQRLIRAGQAALIAAGANRKWARQQTGGLYNIGSHQIIFHTSGVQNGGDHMDHLHISTHAGGRARPTSSSTGPSSPAPRATPRPAAPRLAPAPAPRPVAPPPQHDGPVKQRLFAHPLRPRAQAHGGREQVAIHGTPNPPPPKPRKPKSPRSSTHQRVLT